jgi:hypothetical protein
MLCSFSYHYNTQQSLEAPSILTERGEGIDFICVVGIGEEAKSKKRP